MNTPSSRFRTGSVSAPTTSAERARRVLADGDRLIEVVAEALDQLVSTKDQQGLIDLMAAVSESPDHHRWYLALKITVGTLLVDSESLASDSTFAWAWQYDLMPELLIPYLELRPSEPELLNLLGLAYYELGETPVARRLFEAVREIAPEHAQARANLKAAKHRSGIRSVPDEFTPRSRELHAAAKRVAERATRLEDRTISLCMIVKDEEEMLPGCLEAAAQWVDQLIVVDTGSRDRTREIAAEHGALVIDYPWTGSFSDARNRSIEDATGDWILYLDADEHLIDDDGKHLKELARKTWIEGWYLVEHHYTGEFEMGGQTSHMALRMFQRRPAYRWRGIVHEQKMQDFPVWLPERFANAPVRMNHYGYLRRVVEDRSKRDRNLALLEQQLAEREDAFTNFNIGSEYGAMHDWASAHPYFERALELARAEDAGWYQQQFAPMMISRGITARRGVNDDDGALELIAEGLSIWPDFTDLVFERAIIAGQRGELDAAEADFQLCISMGDAPARYVAVQGRGSFQARAMLANILRTRGDSDGARRELAAAFAEAPQFLPLVLEYAEVLLETEPPEAVAEIIEAQLGARKDSPNAQLLLATAFYESGNLDAADRYYERVLEAQPTNAAALIGRAELSLAQERTVDAIAMLANVDPLDALAPRAARTLYLAGVIAGDEQACSRALTTITDAEHLPMGMRAFYTAWQARRIGTHAVLGPDGDALAQLAENLEALAKLGATDQFEQLVPLLDQVLLDERDRRMLLASIYLRRRFVDMAGEELMQVAQSFGPDAQVLTGLGKVATMKEMWEDAEVFLSESLLLDPHQQDARKLLGLIKERTATPS